MPALSAPQAEGSKVNSKTSRQRKHAKVSFLREEGSPRSAPAPASAAIEPVASASALASSSTEQAKDERSNQRPSAVSKHTDGTLEDPPKRKSAGRGRIVEGLAALPWTALAESQVSSHPAVFTRDNDYYFVATGNSVRIFARSTGEVVSTLSVQTSGSGSSQPRRRADLVHTARITAIALHPTNPLQLVSASMDGTLKVWDYLDATLLRSVDLKFPITHLALSRHHPEHAFVVLRKPRGEGNAQEKAEDAFLSKGPFNSITTSLLLNSATATSHPGASKPSDVHRLGKSRDAAGISISPDGRYLVLIGNCKISIAKFAALQDGFTKFITDESLTCLAFHPTNGTFATGDQRGRIRIWHMLNLPPGELKGAAFGERKAPNTLLHWHSHAVAGLAFTPNGAQLVSGGEEAVLVLWQLATGQKEFVPRIGAPIASVALAGGLEGRGLEYAVRLADGSMTFVSSVNLKPQRTFTRVKVDASRKLLPPTQLISLPVPLATQPGTGTLIMPAGHPSSLQFYDPINDRHLAEIEITPSNRVSRPDDAPLEPTRVLKVTFSHGAHSDRTPADWMATYEARLLDELETERCLKVWKWDHPTGRYGLNTRIADPHAAGLTALSFSPASPRRARGTKPEPILCTAAKDGQMKTWRPTARKAKGGAAYTSWSARSVFGYRGCVAHNVAWSSDGSLLAAAQGAFVTVWDVQTNILQTALPCEDAQPASDTLFAGLGDRFLVATSRRSIMVWDLITGRTAWQLSVAHRIDQLFAPAQSGQAFAIILNMHSQAQQRHISVVQTFEPTSSRALSAFELPFGIRTLAPVWSHHTPSGPDTDARQDMFGPVFYAITTDLQVVAVGSTARTTQSSGSTARPLHSISVARRTLFDDLFGSSVSQLHSIEAPPSALSASKDVFALFDAPAHLLPPLSSILDPFTSALMPAHEVASNKVGEVEREQQGSTAAKTEEEEARAADGSMTRQEPTQQDIDELVQLFRDHVSATTDSSTAFETEPKSNGHMTQSVRDESDLDTSAANREAALNGRSATKAVKHALKAGPASLRSRSTNGSSMSTEPPTPSLKVSKKRKQSVGGR
ncbi:WD40 repeat-like protein [Ceraceosorus guamensis]|uniref:WD40 repeat-like protein n=1 Tax=Ceraceosorus guamensis TaxID=1522189 RepID=A0A316VY12_9BASI|nr:WD40 repeat-like protein [Ceraceosorus guamensis]PWN42516.1 WD40 repeat-like protein [Ceraceosorus guamensis]